MTSNGGPDGNVVDAYEYFRARRPEEDIDDYLSEIDAEYERVVVKIAEEVSKLPVETKKLRSVGYGALRE